MDLDVQAGHIQNLLGLCGGQPPAKAGASISVNSGIGTALTPAYNSAYVGISRSSSNYSSLGYDSSTISLSPFMTTNLEIGKEAKMRVIRYTVVDPDLNLLKTNVCPLVFSDTIVAKGNDNSKLMMDLAIDLVEDLKDYNESLVGVSWLDDKNEPHYFKPRKFSDLDVVIEVVKTYA